MREVHSERERVNYRMRIKGRERERIGKKERKKERVTKNVQEGKE